VYQSLALHPERIDAQFVDGASQFYTSKIADEPGRDIITDKMPANALHLPLIKTLFPASRVIVCERDPVNTCLSNYTQRFTGMHAHTTDLGWLGAYHNAHERAVSAWLEQGLGPDSMRVRYEEVASDPESAAKALCGFLGIEHDPGMAKPHEVERVAATASRAQVQQPVHTKSVDRASKFGDLLDPLREALSAG